MGESCGKRGTTKIPDDADDAADHDDHDDDEDDDDDDDCLMLLQWNFVIMMVMMV